MEEFKALYILLGALFPPEDVQTIKDVLIEAGQHISTGNCRNSLADTVGEDVLSKVTAPYALITVGQLQAPVCEEFKERRKAIWAEEQTQLRNKS